MPYHHLTPSERKVIDFMRVANFSQARIAQALGRSQSTISRELRRNGDRDGYYNPHAANVVYWKRREQHYSRTKRGHKDLMDLVETKLHRKWSPEQIAGRLRYVEYPHDRAKWISHETIYQHVWEDKAHGGTLYRTLRRGRKIYGKRGTGRHPNTFIKGCVSIEQRPAIVNQRTRVGDWEGDTFFGRLRNGCLATLVERSTGFLAAALMPNACASSLNLAVLESLRPVPKALVHTLTVDNGKEFAGFKSLETQLEMHVYFAHPYSAWERAINENTNGLLRQYFPKKTNLSTITQQQLQDALQCLNDRPRKRLLYRTPRELLSLSILALDT